MDIFRTRQGASPILLSMPHSGMVVPPTLVNDLTQKAQQLPDTDWHLSRLYSFADVLDATTVQANYSRYVIDLNRPPDNAALYPGQPGTDLCPLHGFDGDALYHPGSEPDEQEVDRRWRQYWMPYHTELKAQIDRIKKLHGFVVLYDCHSIRSRLPRLFDGELPVFNLGTADGTACSGRLQSRIEQVLVDSPYRFAVNGRFKGGYITRHYGNPSAEIHAIQMELAQSAYMEETPGYNYLPERAKELQRVLEEVLQLLLHWRPGQQSLV